MDRGGVYHGGEGLSGRKLRKLLFGWATFAVVLTTHVLVIGVPLLWGSLTMLGLGGCRHERVREERFKVKLGGSEPSHAPEVGPPERLRPTTTPDPGKTPKEPTQVVKPKPRQQPTPKEPTHVVKPKPRPQPTPKEPTKVVRPKPRPQPTPREPNVDPYARARQKLRQQRAQQQRSRTSPPRQRRTTEEDDGIYHPPGGNNFNRNIKIGNRETGQKRGPADHRTPQAVDDDEIDQKWNDSVGKFVDMLWTPPENVFWGDNPPRAVLELVVSADGRVLRARLVKSSGNARMDATIQQLIRQLTGKNAPRPPGGPRTIEVELIPNK